jgi:hypothetical protein
MKSRIESKIIDSAVMFRAVCTLCGRTTAFHRDLTITEVIAERHEKIAHGVKEAA